MSETIEPTDETIELPTKDEVDQWINKLKSRDVPIELLCHECGATVETKVPRDEKTSLRKLSAGAA